MRKFLAAASAVSLLVVNSAFAALDTEITGAVTDVTGLWDTIKPVVLGIVVFMVAIGFIKMLRKR